MTRINFKEFLLSLTQNKVIILIVFYVVTITKLCQTPFFFMCRIKFCIHNTAVRFMRNNEQISTNIDSALISDGMITSADCEDTSALCTLPGQLPGTPTKFSALYPATSSLSHSHIPNESLLQRHKKRFRLTV